MNDEFLTISISFIGDELASNAMDLEAIAKILEEDTNEEILRKEEVFPQIKAEPLITALAIISALGGLAAMGSFILNAVKFLQQNTGQRFKLSYQIGNRTIIIDDLETPEATKRIKAIEAKNPEINITIERYEK